MAKTDRTLNVQTPGAPSAAQPESSTPSAAPGDANEQVVDQAADLDMPKTDAAPASELPPDLQAIVAAEVAKALAKQAAANRPVAGQAVRKEESYEQAEARMKSMTPEERRTMRPILTDRGWLVAEEYGASANKATLG